VAFPTVASELGGNEATNDTSYTITGITGATAGQRLLVFLACDGVPTTGTWPTDWVQRKRILADASAAVLEIWEKVSADGTETDFGITLSASEMKAHRTMRIASSHASAAVEVSTGVVGTSTTPDPDSLTPSWGSNDTLWFAVTGTDAQPSVTSYPTSYGLYQSSDHAASSGGAHVGKAGRELAAASDNPGTFTIGSSQEWAAVTVGVRPEAAAAVPTLPWVEMADVPAEVAQWF